MSADDFYVLGVMYALFSMFMPVVVVCSFIESKETGSVWPVISAVIGMICWILLGASLFRR